MYRPHQSLGYLTPVEFARRWRKENDVRVSQQVDRCEGTCHQRQTAPIPEGSIARV